jgi:hypothetical protein
MRRALYYPHTEIREGTQEGENLLKRALLLWDKLEYIAPDENYTPYYSDRRFAEAIDVIGKRHVPTDEEKNIVHSHIEEFLARPKMPEVFYYHGQPEPYEIYPQKFSDRTWRLLRDSKLTGEVLPWSGDYPLTLQAGLVMMALLADTCAGELCSRITDRPQSYASLTGLLIDNPELDDQPEETRDRLVSVSLKLLDIRDLSLESLIDFRKREDKEGGLTELRRNYLDHIEGHLDRLRKCSLKSDKARLDEEFEAEMKRDVTNLGTELSFEFKDALFSKEIFVSLAVGVAAVATAMFGGPLLLSGVLTASSTPATVAGVLSTRNKYYKNRAKIMRDHPMAYIYQLQSGVTTL